MRIEISESVKALKEHDNILLVTHLRPDGDTLGSACALCHALRRSGKRAFLFDNDGVTENYADYVAPYLEESGFEPEYIVAVDLADPGLFPNGFRAEVDLCIDHHPSNTDYAKNSVVWAHKASCGELVMELVLALCGDIDEEEANLLYIAVSTDTGCFCYANTTAETLRAAAALIDAGANNRVINKKIFRTYTLERVTLESLVYTELRQYRGGDITVITVTQDMLKRAGATENDMEDIAALAGRIKGTKAGVTIKETEEGYSKISLRTGGQVNASEVCKKFGGGGHAMAAGCTIEKPCAEAEKLVVQAINEAFA